VTNFRNRINRPPSDAQAFAVPAPKISASSPVTTHSLRVLITTHRKVPKSISTSTRRPGLQPRQAHHPFRRGVIYRQLSVFNFAQGFPSITVNPPASPNINDLLNSTIVQIVIGNRKGIRLPATPDNSYRNTRFAAYAEDSGACVQTWWRATEFATKWTRTRGQRSCEAADCFDAAAARLAGDADQCQELRSAFRSGMGSVQRPQNIRARRVRFVLTRRKSAIW